MPEKLRNSSHVIEGKWLTVREWPGQHSQFLRCLHISVSCKVLGINQIGGKRRTKTEIYFLFGSEDISKFLQLSNWRRTQSAFWKGGEKDFSTSLVPHFKSGQSSENSKSKTRMEIFFFSLSKSSYLRAQTNLLFLGIIG